MSIFARFASRLTVSCLLAASVWGQGTPPTVSDKAPTADPYSKEAFVLEQTSAKLVFENDGTFTREDFAKIRIQSEAGVQRYEVLTFPYASSVDSLEIDFVRVHKHDGTVMDTPSENIQDMASEITRQAPFYSDIREKHVAVKGLGPGDILEFKSHLVDTKPLAPGKFWFAYGFTDSAISLDEQLEINVPAKSEIKIASARVKPEISQGAKYRTYRWHYSNLQQKPKEDQQIITYQQTRGRLPEPDVQISNFQSWDEVGRWYEDLQRDRVKPTPEIQAKAAQLTKGASDDDAKLRAIYKYVSTEFHYIGIAFGIGRYQPHSAGEVLANQYGDCKDKHTLLASLLTAAGFKVYPALISTSHQLDPDIPSPAQFDHVITAVQRGTDVLWLDSTPEVGPFGYLISPLWGKQALVVHGDNPASLITTPADPNTKTASSFNIKATLADTGVLEGKIERMRRGDDFEVLFRSAFRRTPFPQWKDLIQQISYWSGFAGDVSEVTASSPEATDVPFEFSYKYSRKDYPDWANHKIDPPLPPLGLPGVPDDDKKLTAPLWLGAPGEYRYVSEVELPKGFRAEPPDTVDIKTEFADYVASSENRNGKLITRRLFTIKLHEVPMNDYEEYMKFKKKAEEDHDAQIALVREIALVTDSKNALMPALTSDNPEAMRAFNEAKDANKKHDVKGQIEALKRTVEKDPKFTQAWMWLGSLYASTQQTRAAMDAFHRAIDIDPQQSVPYKILGATLMNMRNYEQAIPVLQKLISLAPQDVDGPSNLGYIYLHFKNYKDAVIQYEAATKLLPDRAFLQMELGASYLHAGAEDRAMDTFKKAMELDPRANMLNSVAYELADADRKLPEALQFALKAVHDEEEISNKVDLGSLKTQDLESTQSLAAFWDTLGWVYFRMNDCEKALSYLDSGWRLSLNGIQADHLGQVYEKLGKKSEAMQMYLTAISAGPIVLGLEIDAVKDRLKHLEGGASVARRDDTVESNRMFKLPRLVQGQATAEFFLLFSPQAKEPGFKLDDIKFISGSEKLKSAMKQVSALNFKVRFPDNGPSHIIRRGMLGCYEYTGCSLFLLPPDSVHSID